jgi:hypothetical protein
MSLLVGVSLGQLSHRTPWEPLFSSFFFYFSLGALNALL